MTFEIKFSGESFIANITLELLDTVVIFKMLGQVATLNKAPWAIFESTFERLLASMDSNMIKEIASFF